MLGLLLHSVLGSMFLPLLIDFDSHVESILDNFASILLSKSPSKLHWNAQPVFKSFFYQILVDFGSRRTLILILPWGRQCDFHSSTFSVHVASWNDFGSILASFGLLWASLWTPFSLKMFFGIDPKFRCDFGRQSEIGRNRLKKESGSKVEDQFGLV